MNRRALVLATAVFLTAIVFAEDIKTKTAAPATEGSPYLFVWSGDAAHQATDFLAVIDVKPSSPSYGRIVSSVPVAATGTMPHHTEYEFPQGNLLFAEGWVASRSFIFDLNQPLQPRLAAQFHDRDGYIFPHSFVRLPNGHVLATFQSRGEGYGPGGGLVELDESGAVLRSASAVDPAVDKNLIWPYSMAVAPQADRVVSSSSPMGWPDWATLPAGSWPAKKINDQETAQVQVWRLSDLHLLNTVTLPADSGKHNLFPAEPRLLADGSVYVNTFSCGLYRMKELNGAQPSAEMVYSFPGGDSMHTICSVPVVVGHYWIQTVAALPGLIALDVSHPEKPVEVSRLKLDSQFPMPHWLAADRKGDRLVITGDEQSWVLVARFDADKGTLSLDQSFREPGASGPGISFDRQQWPHGKGGRAIVHGALFGPH
jgi:56kDa selenium binding protein (SBP56)